MPIGTDLGVARQNAARYLEEGDCPFLFMCRSTVAGDSYDQVVFGKSLSSP